MQVYLIGFMGAGKSSLGSRLAKRLDIPFVDMDAEIEKQEDCSIAEIFEGQGEAGFRMLEKSWIESFSNDNAVIALGGGTPCQKGMMDLLLKKGIPVFMNVSTGIIVSRLMNAKSKRPLIDDFREDKNKLAEFVNDKLKERLPDYLQANLIVEASDLKAEDIDLIADLVKINSRFR